MYSLAMTRISHAGFRRGEFGRYDAMPDRLGEDPTIRCCPGRTRGSVATILAEKVETLVRCGVALVAVRGHCI